MDRVRRIKSLTRRIEQLQENIRVFTHNGQIHRLASTAIGLIGWINDLLVRNASHLETIQELNSQITYLKKQLFEKAQELNKKQTCDACELVNSLRVQLAVSEIKREKLYSDWLYARNRQNAYQIKADLYYESVEELISQLVLAKQNIQELNDELAKYIDAPKGENANNPQETTD